MPVGSGRVGETIAIYVRIDDDGSGGSSGMIHECRTDNNLYGPANGLCLILGFPLS